MVFLQVVGVSALLFVALYNKSAASSGKSPGTRLLAAFFAWVIIMAVFAGVAIRHKAKGGEVDWRNLTERPQPQDRWHPPDWWFDEDAGRWRKPRRLSR